MYVITTPVHNELSALPALVACVERLVPRPALWFVVDDSSNDGSREWLALQCVERSWMQVVDAPEQADEYLGGHVARIKRWGLEEALCKADKAGLRPAYAGVLDADIELAPDHYARLIGALESDPSLGVVSSAMATVGPGGRTEEPFQRYDLPRGATQFFRRDCLASIGGLPPWPGFDGAANVKAQMRGWRTQIVPGAIAVHRRPTATRFGLSAGFARKGRYAWFLGLHPILVVARTLAYCTRPPFTSGWYFFKGWVTQAIHRERRCPDPEIRRGYGIRRVLAVARAALRGRTQHYPPAAKE